MKRSFVIAIFFTLLLFALLLIPLDGKVDNTFLFFLGRFHPIILHLPIGALMVLLLMEIINKFRPKLNLDAACNILLWFSVFSIIPTITLGFLLASSGSYDDELLNFHKWLGWFTALICVWLVVIRQKKLIQSNSGQSRFYYFFLSINVALLSLAGHYGGYLTHGEDYLTKYMPLAMKNFLNIDNLKDQYLVINTEIDSTSKEALYFKKNIRPIVETYCFECHGQEKQKGDMRLDTLHWNMMNGRHAERWHSALNVINLGEMPPKKKSQLKDEERRQLVNWLSNNLQKAAIAKRKDNKSVMRRLTKTQYTNSLNELLDVMVNFGDVLPNDGKSKMGFSNNGNILQTSALHIDYYQKIAREAMDKAIVFGPKPQSKRYKVTLGKNLGCGEAGAEFGGYQTAPVNNEDLVVEILNGDGNPIQSANELENEELVRVKNKIGIGMRGSASNRYNIVKEGMVLNSALPAKEVTPKSWQGPSPNLKLLIKEDFPRTGDFAFRVEASKGYHSTAIERLIDLRNDKPAISSSKTINIVAKELKYNNDFVLKNKHWLMSKDVAQYVDVKFTFHIPKSGIYQIDLIHPYVSDDLTPSYRISLLGDKKEGIIGKRINMDIAMKSDKKITTPVTLVYLAEGEHKGTIGGKFFVGFSHIAITPLPEEDPLPKILENEAIKDNSRYAAIDPSIQVFAGSRTDDGMHYKTFSESIKVTAPLGEVQNFEFTGRLENLPIPLASNDLSGELANIFTIGLWNNHLVKESSLKGPPLLIKSLEFEAPYYPVWPPKSHTNIFFDSPNKDDSKTYASEVIDSFMQRAFRRPLNPGELNRYLSFWENIKDDFERYVYVSSSGVYKENQELPINENDPIDEYSRHIGKYETEKWLCNNKVPFTSFRPTYIYGPGNYNKIENWFFERIVSLKKVPIPIDGSLITQLGHVSDLTDAMIKSITYLKTKNNIYNCSGDRGITIKGLILTCADVCNIDRNDIEMVSFDHRKIDKKSRKSFPIRLNHYQTSISKLKEDLDWEPKFNLFDGLKNSFENDFKFKLNDTFDFDSDKNLFDL